MRVNVSPEARAFVWARGGRLWVWSARPALCCGGTPAFMHASTALPAGLSGFTPTQASGLEIWFRPPGGRFPDVLEIGVRGKRQPRVEAYWDGCLYAM